jgi:starch phosphorylase
VRIVEAGHGPDATPTSGRPIEVRATVDLAGLTPRDVRVEAVVGRVGPSGRLEHSEVLTLPSVEGRDSVYVFAKEIIPHETGRLGYTVRIAPDHYEDPLTRPCNAPLKWASVDGSR